MAATFKIEKLNDFTVMTNHHLRNKKLSLKAKGLQSLMLSLPDGWDYTMKGLASICKDGVDSIASALKELEVAGYVVRKRKRNAKGQLTDTEYVIYQIPPKSVTESRTNENKPKQENPEQADDKIVEIPELEKPKQEKPKWENPVLDKPEQVKPKQEKRHQLNTQGSNTKGSNIQSINLSAKDDGEIEEIREMIKDNIDYVQACKAYSKSQIDSIVDIMLEVYIAEGSIVIGQNTVNANYAKMVFDKIDYDCLVYVLDCFTEASSTKKIKNIKKYLLTSLYNSPMTIDSYYAADLNYDMAGNT